jgi:hypothetical protein
MYEEGIRMKYFLTVLICIALVPAASLADYTKTTVYAIQQGAFAVGDSVRVDSVVVTNVDRKATTYGFHVQEQTGGPWSGILVYCTGALPDVQVGDLVNVWGDYDEYYDHSEIQVFGHPNGGFEIVQEDFGELACELLSSEDLGTVVTDTLCEKWEGVFICVDTVIVTEWYDYQEWAFEEAHDHPGDDSISTIGRCDDKCVIPTLPKPPIGDTLVVIRGTFAYEYDNYKIWPRSASDVVYLHGSPPPSVISAYPTSNTSMEVVFDVPLEETSAEYTGNYSLQSTVSITSATLDLVDSLIVTLTTGPQPTALRDSITVCDVLSGGGTPMVGCQTLGFRAGVTPISTIQTPTDTTDASPMDGERVTLTGIIVNADSVYNGPFFMQTKEGGPWNGIYIYAFPQDPYDVGDSVVVSGFVQEYYNWTEISGVDYIEWAGTDVSFTGPMVVTPNQIRTSSATAESYESVFIQMDSVEVFTYLDGVGEWTCGIGSDTVAVGDFTCAYNPCYDYPGCGSWIKIKGPIRYHYSEFKIEPRENSDIEVLVPCTSGVEGDEKLALRLAQNAPNPFVGETMIKFSVPRKMNVKLSVYDISGRLVRTVAEGDMDAGEHSFAWDGRDGSARSVSPGIYFLRMSTPERSLQKKMVLLH